MIVQSIRWQAKGCAVTVAELVARRRDELGISQATLAKRIERHPSFISQIEQRSNPAYLPDPELALALAKALELRVECFTAAAGYVDAELPSPAPDRLADPQVRVFFDRVGNKIGKLSASEREAVERIIDGLAEGRT